MKAKWTTKAVKEKQNENIQLKIQKDSVSVGRNVNQLSQHTNKIFIIFTGIISYIQILDICRKISI